ncbi:MAG: CPBP family intramembrane metalloprotease [Chloroflexi bacterium]|nr:CPBP family intramembrane metalloprotease [Chloroflexota bacterium]
MIARVVVFAVVTAVSVVVFGGLQQATGLRVDIGIPQLAPGVAGLLMLLIFRKDGHPLTWVRAETPPKRYGLALAMPLGINAVVFMLSLLLLQGFSLSSYRLEASALMLLWMPLGALGEEIGWRGYLQKRLNVQTSGRAAAVITGVLWTFLHVHFFANGPIFMLFTTLLFVSMSIVMQAVLADQDFSVLLATLFHIGINIGSLLLVTIVNDLSFMVIFSLVWAGAAGAAVALRREFFFKAPSGAQIASASA